MTEIKPGAYVKTPCQRVAKVLGMINDRLDLRYLDDGEEVLLKPEMVVVLTTEGEL